MRSIVLLLTIVLPTPLPAPSGPVAEEIGDRRGQIVIGVHQAARRLTMPWRSASVSLAKAMSNLSRMPIRLAMA